MAVPRRKWRDPQAPKPRRRRSRPTYRVAGAIDLTATGIPETMQRVGRLGLKVNDVDTIMAAVEPVEEAIGRLFEAEGRGRWEPTKPETTELKRKRGQRTEPMRASDRLYQSLVDSDAPGAIRRPRKKNTELVVSSRFKEIVFQARAGRLATIVDRRGEAEATDAVRRRVLR